MKGKRNVHRKGKPQATENRRNCNSSERRERDERSYDRRGDNDVSWYTRYPQLSVAAASFPYPYRPGMEAVIADGLDGKQFSLKIPGVMALSWMPSLGKSSAGTDPASVVAKELYARIRKAYSGSLEADGPDILMYVGALDSLFAYIAYLKRIYRILTAWSPDNYILPDVLLKAIGVTNPDDLRANRVLMYQHINELILQSRKFTCPAVMDLFNRHYWMSDNVYTDAQSINSQLYVFTPAALFQFAELNMPGTEDAASGLKMVAVPKGNSTEAQLYQFGLSLVDALVQWDTSYTINGYLSRAFEGVPTFTVDDLPIDQPFSPVYSEEVLTQIENSMVLPKGLNLSDLSGMNVTQDVNTNTIQANPHLFFNANDFAYTAAQWNKGFWKINPTLSIRSDAPTVADNIIASRLKTHISAIELNTGNTQVTAYLQAGTEIALGWKVFLNGTSALDTQDYFTIDYREANTGFFTDVTAFDWHPLGWEIINVSTLQHVYCIGDIHNLTVIHAENLENLHRICVYSELSAFSIA